MCLILRQPHTLVHHLPLPCQVPLGPKYNMGDGNVPLLAGFTDTWHSLCPFKRILEQGSGIKTFDLLLTMWINSVFPPTHTVTPTTNEIQWKGFTSNYSKLMSPSTPRACRQDPTQLRLISLFNHFFPSSQSLCLELGLTIQRTGLSHPKLGSPKGVVPPGRNQVKESEVCWRLSIFKGR